MCHILPGSCRSPERMELQNLILQGHCARCSTVHIDRKGYTNDPLIDPIYKSYNAPFCDRNICAFLLQVGALCGICPMHCGICEVDPLECTHNLQHQTTHQCFDNTNVSIIAKLTIVYSTVYSGAYQRNIKVPRHWPSCGESTGHRWIPHTKGQKRGKCFHLMTSSWYRIWNLTGRVCSKK